MLLPQGVLRFGSARARKIDASGTRNERRGIVRAKGSAKGVVVGQLCIGRNRPAGR